MNELEFWSVIISALLASLAWPAIILCIVLIFKRELKVIIPRIKKTPWFEFYDPDKDKLDFSTIDSLNALAGKEVTIQAPTAKATATALPPVAEITSRVSDAEIEQSKMNALRRLNQDTAKVGYQRGKLYQRENGRWGISWDVEVSDGIILKG